MEDVDLENLKIENQEKALSSKDFSSKITKIVSKNTK